jgi:hypothetical protein
MPSTRLIIAVAFVAALGIHNASALEIDDSGKTSPASANLMDPDSKMPVAHLGDDGKMEQSSSGFKFQMQSGNNGSGSGFNSGPSAFERAQQNQVGQ